MTQFGIKKFTESISGRDSGSDIQIKFDAFAPTKNKIAVIHAKNVIKVSDVQIPLINKEYWRVIKNITMNKIYYPLYEHNNHRYKRLAYAHNIHKRDQTKTIMQ